MTSRVFIEIQVTSQNAYFWMTVTLSKEDSHWTCDPIRLEASNSDAATTEAAEKARKLLEIISGRDIEIEEP